MTSEERYARVVKAIAAVLVVLGGWIAVSPVILPGAEDVFVHVGIGGVTAIVAALYLRRLARDPATKVPSVWFVLVLGVLLASGALLTFTPGTPFFWSTVLAGMLLIGSAAVVLYWGSRFGTGEGLETSIYRK